MCGVTVSQWTVKSALLGAVYGNKTKSNYLHDFFLQTHEIKVLSLFFGLEMGFICNGNSCMLSLSFCKNTKSKFCVLVFWGWKCTIRSSYSSLMFAKDSRHFFYLYFNHKALTVLTKSHMWFDAVWLSCIVPNTAYPTVHV